MDFFSRARRGRPGLRFPSGEDREANMAAVQPTQGMQQHGHNNTMAAQASNILPPGMTKDGVTQIYRV